MLSTETLTTIPFAFPNLVQRELTENDLNSLLNFRKTIFTDLSMPDLVLPETNEMQWGRSRIGSNGKCIGLFESDGNLVAYASLYFPSSSSAEMFFSLGDIPKRFWNYITIIDSCMVHPRYRGYGLQKYFIRERCNLAHKYNRHFCVSLTSLANATSRHNLMSSGFAISWIGETAKNRLRQLLIHDLSEVATINSHCEVTWVPVTDIEQQKLLLSKGCHGIRERQNQTTEIGYTVSINKGARWKT